LAALSLEFLVDLGHLRMQPLHCQRVVACAQAAGDFHLAARIRIAYLLRDAAAQIERAAFAAAKESM
jgi:hypothetical protein